jgi:DNA repair protein RadC
MNRPLDAIPQHDRPREKLRAHGAAALKDHELLAILVGKGTTKIDVMTLAENLVQAVDAKGLNLKVEDLEHLEGMGAVKAMIVVAALEFARRRIKPGGLKITTTAEILPLIRHFADRKQEHFLCITINGANEVLNVRVVSIGLLDRTPVHPREVFADAITDRASGIILARNHPEGGVELSEADAEVTRRIKQAGEIVGIHLLDHIIFNPTAYFSFLEEAKL